MKQEYGLVIGRFQPFHFGHSHIINEIILDGKTPIVIIGTGGNINKNPLTPNQVQTLISMIYPSECHFIHVPDALNWTAWFDDIGHKVRQIASIENLTLYYYNKECDRYKYFECYNRTYHNEFYTKIFEDNEIKIKEIEFVNRSDIHVSADATNIRDNFEEFKHLLDGRVYHQLKKWGWK